MSDARFSITQHFRERMRADMLRFPHDVRENVRVSNGTTWETQKFPYLFWYGAGAEYRKLRDKRRPTVIHFPGGNDAA
jgi:hypothetical protein